MPTREESEMIHVYRVQDGVADVLAHWTTDPDEAARVAAGMNRALDRRVPTNTARYEWRYV